MNSKIFYKNNEQVLVDDFMDIGYMAENVKVLSTCKEKIELQRSHEDKSMTLFMSYPSCEFEKEILIIDEFLHDIHVGLNCYLIFSEFNEQNVALEQKLKKFKVFFDEEDEYGNMYGTKIESGSLEGKLTKALFLISKDGAVFYIDMPNDLQMPLDLERLHAQLNKAYITYTGVGCHG